MSAITDKARDFWDRISPRERRIVVIAAVAVPLTIAVWLGLAIHDGLVAMEARNDKARKALDVLADLRARGQTHQQVDDAVATMGVEPLSLGTYLDKAAQKAKFPLKGTTPHPAQTRNGFITNSTSCTLDDITIQQLKDFLMEVEMGSKVVAVTHIDLRRDFRQKDKLDVNLEVSTYSKEPPPKGEGSGSAGSGSDDKKGG
jgi:type II secretory pathway component PulM